MTGPDIDGTLPGQDVEEEEKSLENRTRKPPEGAF